MATRRRLFCRNRSMRLSLRTSSSPITFFATWNLLMRRTVCRISQRWSTAKDTCLFPELTSKSGRKWRESTAGSLLWSHSSRSTMGTPPCTRAGPGAAGASNRWTEGSAIGNCGTRPSPRFRINRFFDLNGDAWTLCRLSPSLKAIFAVSSCAGSGRRGPSRYRIHILRINENFAGFAPALVLWKRDDDPRQP